MSTYTWHSKKRAGYCIEATYDEFPGCCGMALIHSMRGSWVLNEASEKEQKAVLQEYSRWLRSKLTEKMLDLLEYCDLGRNSKFSQETYIKQTLNVNKLVCADAIGSEHPDCVSFWKMYKYTKTWDKLGSSVKNINSGNKIALFESNRTNVVDI